MTCTAPVDHIRCAAPRGARRLVVLLPLALSLVQVCGQYTDAKPIKFTGKFDPFKVLGLPKSKKLPAADVLKKAFKKGALQWHPDRCKRTRKIEECETRMEEVKLAQEVLSDDRKLMQWEAWREDKVLGPRRREPGQRSGSQQGGGSAFSFGEGGDPFASFGQRPRTPPRPAPRPPPPRPPPPPPRPPPPPVGKWRVLKREPGRAVRGASTEVVTRERDLEGTPMVQVEIVERTCYDSQVECQEQVIERKRRRRDAEL